MLVIIGGDVVNIIFASTITGGEKTTLDTLVANHTPNNVNYQHEKWILQDKKTVATNGGSSTANTWVQRDINTISYNDGDEITIDSNQITCQIGKYNILIRAVAGNVGSNKLRLYNITDSTIDAEGMVSQSNATQSFTTLETLNIIWARAVCSLSQDHAL